MVSGILKHRVEIMLNLPRQCSCLRCLVRNLRVDVKGGREQLRRTSIVPRGTRLVVLS
jgi:hypothetical protein